MAFSASGRLICRRLLSGTGSSLAHAHRRITTSSPWLMLPPKFNDDTSSINHNFYSLAERRLVTLPQMKGGQLSSDLIPNPIHDLRFRGSSYGWLALFNPHTFRLFLYDPISHRHINLPPMISTSTGVTKLTLSSSPDDDNCRAVMIFNHNGIDDALAFCCPGRSKEWTPIIGGAAAYKDFVYSPRQNLFFGLNKSYEFQTWDLTSDPSSPRMIKMIKADDDKCYDKGRGLISKDKVEYLVVADEFFSHDEDRVLLVTRYLVDQMIFDEDDNRIPGPLDLYPPSTLAFDIDVYHDAEEGDFKPLAQETLDDFTLFIGCHSDSVALRATRFPELKPNTIYFNDPLEPTSQGSDIQFWTFDFGIFDYKTKNLAGCFIPCDVQRLTKVVPSKMWFFPRGSGV